MRFSVDVNVVRQPDTYDKYISALVDNRPLDTGSRVVGATYHSEDGTVYCEFKIRS